MKIVLADDEPLARALLHALIAEMPGNEIVAEAADGDAAVAAVRMHGPDLVFLDIDMPGRNGINAALEIAEGRTEIIFVTAHEEHAVDAFDMGAVDYLLKPVRRPRLAKAMERARLRFEARGARPSPHLPPPVALEGADAIWVPVRQGTVRLEIGDIVRVEAAGDLVYLHTAERAYLYRATMGELEQRLQGSGLMRVHRSAFVRPERVAATRRRGKVIELILDDGTQVPLGPSYRAAVLAKLVNPLEA
jgi:DNA-binding LytR/AlgR family response regulator